MPGQEVDQRELGREIVEKDCQARKLDREDVIVRCGWRRWIGDD